MMLAGNGSIVIGNYFQSNDSRFKNEVEAYTLPQGNTVFTESVFVYGVYLTFALP